MKTKCMVRFFVLFVAVVGLLVGASLASATTIVGSASVESAPVHGSVTLTLSSSAKRFVLIGNKNGGGANDTVYITSNALGRQSVGYPVNGQWQTIYNSTAKTGSVYIEYDLNTGGIYNLVFLAYDN